MNHGCKGMRNRMRKWSKLKKGDKVGIVATGFAVEKEKVLEGISCLQSMGYQVVLGESLFKRSGYFAGKENDRSSDLHRMICHPEIRAIFFARGGFGTSKIINSFPFSALKKDPKPLVGYSDLTGLFLAIRKRAALPVLYGPVVSELGTKEAYDGRSLWSLLKGEKIRLDIADQWILQGGKATGEISGGCLTLISTLLGTPYEPDFQNKILFLEEVGEEMYRVERLLHHLKMAGKLQRLKGVVVGQLTQCPPTIHAPGRRHLKELLKEYLGHLNTPIIYHFPAGHGRRKVTLPLGGNVRIDTEEHFIEFSIP